MIAVPVWPASSWAGMSNLLRILLVGTLAFAAPAVAQELPRADEAPAKIEVRATAIAAFEPRDPGRTQFGALEFRGGLQLTSPYRHFGGFSGLHVEPDGARFLSVSDRGRWLRGRIVYQSGRPAGIADAEMAPMLGSDGQPLAVRGWYDTESLTMDRGIAYVGIERVNRIVRFDYGKDGLLARGEPIPVPPGVQTLPSNKGLEALAVVPAGMPLAGTLIALSERGLDRAGNILAFLIGGPTPGTFTLRRNDDFDVTDATVTAEGELLVLERRFGFLSGAGMRIRAIPLGEIKPGALIVGRALIEADLGYEIDNMEGISLHKNAAGETIITIVSDDNFSPIQRTILLQFAFNRR
ncbi:MAG TPA: esterase-like activity of phytase family protein [Xanthobacteraceae bacterium]|nr:esterase-like activity of phytase family protein [Xanthobacteraceae bacterium]